MTSGEISLLFLNTCNPCPVDITRRNRRRILYCIAYKIRMSWRHFQAYMYTVKTYIYTVQTYMYTALGVHVRYTRTCIRHTRTCIRYSMHMCIWYKRTNKYDIAYKYFYNVEKCTAANVQKYVCKRTGLYV